MKPAVLPRVLVVDDQPFVRAIMKRLLAPRVSSILEASNGKEALGIIGDPDAAIDIVFLDLMMPEMDGVEVVRHIADRPGLPSFVFVSGVNAALLAAAVGLASLRGLNVLGAIEKPVDPAALDAIFDMGKKAKVSRSKTPNPLPIPKEYLADAVREEWLELHYQPKVNLSTMGIDGFESLVRLRHPDLGLIPPGIFIPLAEETGLIGKITNHVLLSALQQSASWRDAGIDTKVSVNLSAKMLVDLDLPDRIEEEARRCGAKPQEVILEITESGVFADEGNSLDILTRLCMKGFLLSIDDFGTGYSSLAQLRRVPFTELKIDRAFVTGIHPDSKDYSILDSSIALGKKLGLTVVAEGAETDNDIALLRNVGADVVQGYHISRPMRAQDVPDWMANWRANQTSRS